jgi:hypothetical protein
MKGSCHCGNLASIFESRWPPEELPVWVCDCAFCRLHGVRTTSDPQGTVSIHVKEPGELSRYRFGLAIADFLVCRRCGVYLASVLRTESPDDRRATINVNTLAEADRFTRAPGSVVSYVGESAAARLERRKSNWTPVAEFREG